MLSRDNSRLRTIEITNQAVRAGAMFVIALVAVIFAASMNLASAQADFGYIDKWGEYGHHEADGEFNRPYGIAIDSDGNVFVADTRNNRIQKSDINGSFIEKWGNEGTGDGEFKLPSGVTVDLSGNIYVNDRGNSRIQKFHEIPGNTTRPTISGNPQEGQELTCSQGIWDVDQIGFEYQWQRNGEDIALANSSTYTVVTADVDTDLTCRVTATNENGSSSATSDPVRPVPIPLPTPSQSIQPPPTVPASKSSPVVEETYESACNLKITSPYIKRGKSGSAKITLKNVRRLFTKGFKGHIKWGEAGGKEVDCKKIKMAIFEKSGRRYYVPGTKTRVSAKYLSAKGFSTKGARFLKKKKVGKLSQRRIMRKRQIKISFRPFNRRSRLGRRALRILRKKGYRGTFVVLHTAKVGKATVKKTVTFRVKGKR